MLGLERSWTFPTWKSCKLNKTPSKLLHKPLGAVSELLEASAHHNWQGSLQKKGGRENAGGETRRKVKNYKFALWTVASGAKGLDYTNHPSLKHLEEQIISYGIRTKHSKRCISSANKAAGSFQVPVHGGGAGGDRLKDGQGVLWVGSALPPPKERPVPWEQSGPKVLLVEALLAVNDRSIIQVLGDKRERWVVELEWCVIVASH